MYSEKPKYGGSPESPTTARELDFDDEPHEPLATNPKQAPIPKTEYQAFGEDTPPPKPPRPLPPIQQAENTLKEAFPTIDVAVIKAVLRASRGNVEPAFDALLGMSDPEAQREPIQPEPARNPLPKTIPTSTGLSQMEADAQYARQLAEYYDASTAPAQPPRQPPRREPSPEEDSLQVIGEKIKKSFLETQSVVSTWIKKKIDGDEDEDEAYQHRPTRPARPATNYDPRPSPQQYANRRSRDFERRSVDRDRYDADPHVLGDDFASLQLRDHEEPARRPLANPNLFKPTPQRPQSGNGRQVAFREGPPEEIVTPYRRSPEPTNRAPSTGSSAGNKSSKWQPLSALDPSPVADHDPFSLGDSDDEELKKKEIRLNDNAGPKQATVESVSEDTGAIWRTENEPGEKPGDVQKQAAKLQGERDRQG